MRLAKFVRKTGERSVDTQQRFLNEPRRKEGIPVMFTKIAAAVIAASVIAAPALARTTTVIKTSPAGVVKVIKHKHHVRHFNGKHVKVVKITHARKHQHHRAHVVRNLHAPVKASGRI